jgi:hypothetical protein
MDFLYFTVLLICHWAGDFTHLSRPYMLAAKKFGTPAKPIFDHAAVHGTLMGVATFCFTGNLLAAAIVFTVQLATHFFIDVLKGKCNKWFPTVQNPAKYPHWYLFGVDQFLHIMVIAAISLMIPD